MSLAVVALLLLTRLGVHATYATEILPSLVLMGLALGLIFSSAINTATVGVKQSDAGVASAMVNTTQQIGGTMGTAVFSSIYATAVSTYLVSSHDHAAATVYGYTTAFAAAAGVFFVGAFIAATVYTGRRTSPVQRGATAVAS
jgi:hypothetical protein